MKKPGKPGKPVKIGRKSVRGDVGVGPGRAPQTVEEYVEQGSIDEESGDRWLGSDLVKALRFYQRAFGQYLSAIELSGGHSNLDAWYNSSRLLFHVYHDLTKADGVDVFGFVNVDEAICGGESAVVQDLAPIVAAHERAIEVARGVVGAVVPLDLLFNTALVYTEVIESYVGDEQVDLETGVTLGLKTQEILKLVLEMQTRELQKFLKELDGIDKADWRSGEGDSGAAAAAAAEAAPTSQMEEEYVSEEITQPSDIFESVLASYRLLQAVMENASTASEATTIFNTFEPFVVALRKITHYLTSTFSEENNSRSDLVSSISHQQLQQLALLECSIEGLKLSNLVEVTQLWNISKLPPVAETSLLASDNIQTIIDRQDLNLETAAKSSENAQQFWDSLTQMSQFLKAAYDLLTKDLDTKKKAGPGSDEGIGSIIALMSNIMITRSDIDLQRSQLGNYEPAIKNQAVLEQNCKTFAKSAMNIACQTGGLRERAAEKAHREKKKAEAAIRLCLLEKKTTVSELDTILGRQRWPAEVVELAKLDYYRSLGANQIQIP